MWKYHTQNLTLAYRRSFAPHAQRFAGPNITTDQCVPCGASVANLTTNRIVLAAAASDYDCVCM